MGKRFNNFIQDNSFMSHKSSFDRSSSNNKTNKNINLNNISKNNIIFRNNSQENHSKFNAIIKPSSAKGLVNVGATCYMNATLQCMAHIKYLTKYLLDKFNNISSKKYKYQLTNAYTEVLKNLWQNNNINYYTPKNFKETIIKMISLFAGVHANDSKDLVLFLIETIHNELNEPNKNYIKKKTSLSNQYK